MSNCRVMDALLLSEKLQWVIVGEQLSWWAIVGWAIVEWAIVMDPLFLYGWLNWDDLIVLIDILIDTFLYGRLVENIPNCRQLLKQEISLEWAVLMTSMS